MCAKEPAAVVVLLGPRSSGKTALLRHFVQRYVPPQAAGVGGGNLVDTRCYIDGRSGDISSPTALAKALLLKGLPQLVQQVPEQYLKGLPEDSRKLTADLSAALSALTVRGKVALRIAGIYVTVPQPAASADVSMATVVKAYADVLEAWEQAHPAGNVPGSREWPLLVIDEANVLMAWSGRYDAELDELLRFFVDVTKATNRSHVMLATSEYAFLEWLNTKIGPAFWQSRVLGDFTESEAEEFLNLRLEKLGQGGVSKEDWAKIYKVCGGNPGALKQAVFCFKDDWPSALALVSRDVWTTMKAGHGPASDAGYTATDYATAVDAILNSGRLKAVHDAKLEAVLGTEALEAMVQANLLAMRPYSHWAADIDAEAFGPGRRSTVVTAPTPMHYYLMGEKRSTLTAALSRKTPQVPPAGSTDQSMELSRPASPMSVAVQAVAEAIAAKQEAIAAKQGQIEGVEGEMQVVSKTISDVLTAKGQGWQTELAYWTERKQMLVDNARQLRDDKGRLQDDKRRLQKVESLLL